jgi:hypothetical protein
LSRDKLKTNFRWIYNDNFNHILPSNFRPIFGHQFATHFWGQFSSFFIIFSVILGRHFLWQFLPTYTGRTPRGWKIDKFRQFWTPKTDFCYIVVSTFFGPSGPPPGGPKSDDFGKKYSLFVGNGHFIGVIYGGRKSESFCKKVTNFKKFHIWGPGPPRSIFDDFDPPRGKSIFEQFRVDFNNFITGQFWVDFCQF